MALRDLQAALSRLYTDATFRRSFFDGEIGADALGLTEVEALQLRSLDPRQIEDYARSLRQKRARLVRKCLTAVANALGADFDARFAEYLVAHPSAPGSPRDDAGRFLEWLSRKRLSDPAYLADLVRCEEHSLGVLAGAELTCVAAPADSMVGPRSALMLTHRARLAEFAFDVVALRTALLKGEIPCARPDPCWVLVGLPRGAWQPRLTRLSPWSARLLNLCDGYRTLDQAIAVVAREMKLHADAGRRMRGEAIAFVRPFAEYGLLDVKRSSGGFTTETRRALKLGRQTT